MQGFEGELWFNDKVQSLDDAKAFDFDALADDTDGVHVVLGAGNYTVLTTFDTVHALFIRNRTAFVK